MRSALVPILLAPPGWVLRGGGQVAAVDVDFANNRAWVKGKGPSQFSSLLTTTRASTGYAATSSRLLVPFLSNIPRITDLGLLVEQAATNIVLWNRDLTNAAWTKSNITAAKDQIGADGVATSASSLTATAGNGTCLQAITLGSSARFQTAYVKRLTGSGVINMTLDNGATWTAITVTAAYTPLSIPTQTLANPTVGFRIVTSGDAIAVDFIDDETGTFATSPISNTTVATARAADAITFNNLNIPAPYTLFFSCGGIPGTTGDMLLGGDSNNGALIYVSTQVRAVVNESGSATANVSSGYSPSPGTAFKAAARFAVNDTNIAANGNLGTHDTSCTPPTLTALGFLRALYSFGSSAGTTTFKRATIFRGGLTDAQLTALST